MALISIVSIGALSSMGTTVDAKVANIQSYLAGDLGVNSQEEIWTFNEDISSLPEFYFEPGGIVGTLTNDSYPDLPFIAMWSDNLDLGFGDSIPVLGFGYADNGSGSTEFWNTYDFGYGYLYLSEDLSAPEYGLNYSKGWYFGDCTFSDPTSFVPVDPPSISFTDGLQLSQEQYEWLQTAMHRP